MLRDQIPTLRRSPQAQDYLGSLQFIGVDVPYTISRLENGKGVLILGSGTVTGEEYFSVMSAHLAEPQDQFGALYYSLTDLTKVEAVDVPTETVKEAAQLGKANFHRNPRVIIAVAAPADVAFGLSRLWQGNAGDETWAMEVFRTRAEAEDWIRAECLKRYRIEGLSFE